VVVVQDALSSASERWPLLLGALFIAFVLFLPGGLISLGRVGRRAPRRIPWLRALSRRA
jgi:ABC-type branched-subunit amino acid transport system permease subunit